VDAVKQIIKKTQDVIEDKEWNDLFEIFWTHWPEKKLKLPGKKAWAKIRYKNELTFDSIIASVKTHIHSSKKWREGYIPNVTTWINQERWEDDITGTIKQAPVANQDSLRDVFVRLGYQDQTTYELMATNKVKTEFINNPEKWIRRSKLPTVRRYINMMPDSAKAMLRVMLRDGLDRKKPVDTV